MKAFARHAASLCSLSWLILLVSAPIIPVGWRRLSWRDRTTLVLLTVFTLLATASASVRTGPPPQGLTVEIDGTFDGTTVAIPGPSYTYAPPGAQIKIVINAANGFTFNGTFDSITMYYKSFVNAVGEPNAAYGYPEPYVDWWNGSSGPQPMSIGSGVFVDGLGTPPPYVNYITLPSSLTSPSTPTVLYGNYKFTLYTFTSSADFYVYVMPPATFQGEWSSAFNYPRGAIVTHNSNTYVRLPADTSTVPAGNGGEPGVDPTQWQVIGGIGPQGPPGPQGVDGATGPQGPAGNTGATGAQGPQGPIGLTGAQGAQGLTGPMGPMGPIGLTGPQGPAGPITHGSVVMLPVTGGVAPPPPAGYSFKGFLLLGSKVNGGGMTTSMAVYTKN